MAILRDRRNKAQSTLVGFHDLLGFGELLSSSGGTLDSAVGDLAYRRIVELRESVTDMEKLFPKRTMFFHFNDTVTAYLDVDIEISSSHTDPSGIAALPIGRSSYLKLLQFIGGCASLHQRSIAREDEQRIGPAGRTFVVLGKRWNLGKAKSKRIFEVPPLHANLAFAEAYLADHGGSKAGLFHRSYDRLYLNDHVWFSLIAGHRRLRAKELSSLGSLGTQSQEFPFNLCRPNINPVTIEIFHRQRTFHSVMSQHACRIANVLGIS